MLRFLVSQQKVTSVGQAGIAVLVIRRTGESVENGSQLMENKYCGACGLEVMQSLLMCPTCGDRQFTNEPLSKSPPPAPQVASQPSFISPSGGGADMTFFEAAKCYLHKWNDIKTRSGRSEYWWGYAFSLFGTTAVSFVLGIIIGIVSLIAGLSEDTTNLLVTILTFLIVIFVFFASLSLQVRRLHDVNRSGWWILILFTVIGAILILFWLCSKSVDEDNRFGNI
jgi:uncharacterized membrane protein YhaH (DUF805 family)